MTQSAVPNTPAGQAWLDKLDAVDPFFGSPAELEKLLEEAPTPTARAWLENQIQENRRFNDVLFSPLSANHSEADASQFPGSAQ